MDNTNLRKVLGEEWLDSCQRHADAFEQGFYISQGKPWKAEKDLYKGNCRKYPYIVRRHPHLGHLCGYVGVSPKHPLYGKDWDEICLNVHGGVTFANRISAYIADKYSNYWFIGFDCGHFGDLSPYTSMHMYDEGDTYKDIDYVIDEIVNLTNQLISIQEEQHA